MKDAVQNPTEKSPGCIHDQIIHIKYPHPGIELHQLDAQAEREGVEDDLIPSDSLWVPDRQQKSQRSENQKITADIKDKRTG